MNDGSISADVVSVLNKWKEDFSKLFNKQYDQTENLPSFDDDNSNNILNCQISIEEVRKAIFKSNTGKACGFDNIAGRFSCKTYKKKDLLNKITV